MKRKSQNTTAIYIQQGNYISFFRKGTISFFYSCKLVIKIFEGKICLAIKMRRIHRKKINFIYEKERNIK